MQDVEMKSTDEKKTEKKEEAPPPKPTLLQEIKGNVQLIERGVASMEPRFAHRVLRTLTALRKRLNADVLRAVIEDTIDGTDAKKALLAHLDNAPSTTAMDVDAAPHAKSSTSASDLPETDVYLRLLVIHLLLDSSSDTARKSALQLAKETTTKIQQLNRRTMDPVGAKIWWAYGRAYELVPTLEIAELRPALLAAQRTAALRRDDDTHAALINLLLRNYLHYNLFSQADKFVSKTSFPQSAANPQLARNHFYLGRIRAVQLNYTEAHDQLQQAIRRAAPPTTAPGFYQTVHKFFVVVELLMGEIPDRQIFRHPVLEQALQAYSEIVQAVRAGSLAQFQTTLAMHSAQFASDATLTLISRLRQNVIKTGIRKLSLAYSRISLRDICLKLNLDSEEDAEYIVGKAIKDGVIDSTIVHEKGWMVARGYEGERGTEGKSTKTPAAVKGYGPEVVDVFGRRISFCLQLHNESVRAMRYPLNAHRKELVSVQAALEREKELSREVMRGEHDDDDDALGDL